MTKVEFLAVLMFVLFSLPSCTTTNKTFWVSGTKSACSNSTNMKECFNVYNGSNLEEAKWETLYASIKGFEFEEGIMKKVLVKEENMDSKNSSTDASIKQYALVKVLEEKRDNRMLLNGDWVLAQFSGNPINRMVALPDLTIDVLNNRIAGHGGCNNYFSSIESLSQKSIDLGSVGSTKMGCMGENIEPEYLIALNKVRAYQVDDNTLRFYDEKDKELMSFLKRDDASADENLNGTWTLTHIQATAVNKTAEPAFMEINLKDKVIAGNNSCNYFNGSVVKSNAKELSFGSIAVTERMCAKMTVANAFNKLIDDVATYQIERDNLILSDHEGHVIFTFKKKR